MRYIVIPKIKKSLYGVIRGASLRSAEDLRKEAVDRFAKSSHSMIQRLEKQGRVRIKETPGLDTIRAASTQGAIETPIVVRKLPLLNTMLIAGPPGIKSALEGDDVAHVIEASELKFRVLDPESDPKADGKSIRWHLDQLPIINGGGQAGSDGNAPWIGIADTGIGEKLRNGPEFGPQRIVEFAKFDPQGNQVAGAPYEDVSPDSHGSAVATLAAGNTHGIARSANLAVALCFDHEKKADDAIQVIEALNWLLNLLVAKGGNAVKVINCSFGVVVGVDSRPSSTFEAVINTISSSGVYVVAAIGNADGTTPAAGFHWSPANYVKVIGVGAVHKDGAHADGFSHHGHVQPAGAPPYFKPDFITYGVDVPTLTRDGDPCNKEGTSFASPIIAGYVAQLGTAAALSTSAQQQVIAALQALGVQVTIGQPPHQGQCYKV